MIGAIEGSFNVNLIGSANYTVGIDIPSGINSLQPNLSLSYNSFGTEGLLGTGWDLGGISMITRTGQNLFYDNNITPVKTNYEDRFMWDGQRLLIKSLLIVSLFFTLSKSFLKYNTTLVSCASLSFART